MSLTQERLQELLSYDPLTGVFIWKVGRSGTNGIGSEAGHKMPTGYIRIKIDGRRYLAHVLAALYMIGRCHDGDVDHRDRNTSNNTWSNLRLTTRANNAANCAARSNNKTGLKGVVRRTRRKKPFLAQITINLPDFTGRVPAMKEAVATRRAA